MRRTELQLRTQKLPDRVAAFKNVFTTQSLTYMRTIISAAGREVLVEDPHTRGVRKMLMFASNNYLGLANHPHVIKRVKKAIDEYGCGIGGPPLLNGYIKLIAETEERLAAFKHQEAAMIFSSGFMASTGVISALAEQNDMILYDALSHASFYDAIKLTKAKALPFSHNNITELESLLVRCNRESEGSLFVCVEGVYSMDGNMAPLHQITRLCKQYGAVLIVDDAHGTGVLGEGGSGTASLQNCSSGVDITMGTFSKVFATCGGFLTGSADVINYLRFHARSYIFSASISPPVAAAVLGGLEVMEQEPWLRKQLLLNTQYAVEKLGAFELCAKPDAAIITLKVPECMDTRKAAYLLDRHNLFINAIEYPAVPLDDDRFRISIMATHTKEDIDKLVAALEEVWHNPYVYTD